MGRWLPLGLVRSHLMGRWLSLRLVRSHLMGRWLPLRLVRSHLMGRWLSLRLVRPHLVGHWLPLRLSYCFRHRRRSKHLWRRTRRYRTVRSLIQRCRNCNRSFTHQRSRCSCLRRRQIRLTRSYSMERLCYCFRLRRSSKALWR
jgi:hypothetical protein